MSSDTIDLEKTLDITRAQLENDALTARGRISYLRLRANCLYKLRKFEESMLDSKKAMEFAEKELDVCDGEFFRI